MTEPTPIRPRWRSRWLLDEDLNFLLTNRVPRALLNRLMGRLSRIESRWFTRCAIGFWRLFTELDLSDAQQAEFTSIHACFTRALVPGARPVEPAPARLASPCDAIVGACGPVEGVAVFQAKGFPYSIPELFGDPRRAEPFRDGCFVTLRLSSAMYHRFHAPHDLQVEHVSFFRGDTWNVNPIALARVEKLFCRNERALVQARLRASGHPLALVPVAAILVASLRLHWIDARLDAAYRGPREFACATDFAKGAEMGWFEHGSTIIVFAPRGFRLCAGIAPGSRIRMGEALMHLPAPADTATGH